MGPSLGLIFANVVMFYNEKKRLEDFPIEFRLILYVSLLFTVLSHVSAPLEYLNNRFTAELGVNKCVNTNRSEDYLLLPEVFVIPLI